MSDCIGVARQPDPIKHLSIQLNVTDVTENICKVETITLLKKMLLQISQRVTDCIGVARQPDLIKHLTIQRGGGSLKTVN